MLWHFTNFKLRIARYLKIINSLENSGIFVKGVKKPVENEKKNHKEVDFLVCY